MVAGPRFSRGEIWRHGANYQCYSKKANQVSWLSAGLDKSSTRLLLPLLLLLTSFAAAQSANAIRPTVSVQELRVPAKARARLEAAQREFSRLNLAGAKREIERALQVDSTFAAAFSMRALLRLATRDPNGAVEDATRAVALDPGEPGAYVALATAYNSRGEYERAEAATQRALTMSPDFWQARLELAKAFYGDGRLVLGIARVGRIEKGFSGCAPGSRELTGASRSQGRGDARIQRVLAGSAQRFSKGASRANLEPGEPDQPSAALTPMTIPRLRSLFFFRQPSLLLRER